MRSARGSSPKIASDSVALPASFPSRATILSSITRRPSSQRQRRRRLLCRLGFRLLSRLLRFSFSRLSHPEFAGLRSFLGQFFLHGIAHGHPPAFGTGHGALDQDETSLDVRL